ncbi:metallopeptidase [soil metagenome]
MTSRVLLGFGALLVASSVAAQVSITNIEPGETVRYPILALRGEAPSDSIAIGADWSHAARFPVTGGQWAGFVELKPGENMIGLQSGRTTVRFKVTYKPMTTPYKVASIYVMGSDGEEKYITNQLNEKYPIREKLDVAMKLLQSACAEAMNQDGRGRTTFNLDTDANGIVNVRFIKLSKTSAEMRAMDNNTAWGFVYDELKKRLPEDNLRWLGVMGFTDFNRTTAKTSGHFALGGGALALFGSGSMGWWPAALRDVPKKMADPYVLDPKLMFEDSAGRSTAWSEVSTGYGAMLHELGHTLGLPHSNDGLSVMSRGFDNFSRWFTVQDPPSKKSEKSVTFGLDQMMRWSPYFATRLSYSPWFQADGTARKSEDEPTIKVDGDVISVTSPKGIKVWGADRDDIAPVWGEIKGSETTKSFSIADLRKRLATDKEFRFSIVDSWGQIANVDVKT